METQDEAWNPNWRALAASSPCGTCTGRFCTVCSIRTGGATAQDGAPSGYSPRVLDYYDASPSEPQTAGRSTVLNASVSNAIVQENLLEGSPESEWLIGPGDPTIEGYAAQFSLNHGETVDFKINTDSTDYRIDIYRLGYYGGMGARKVTTIERDLATAQVQPDPLFDAQTRLVDAGNWNVSASWDIPADAVSGVYYAVMTRMDGSGGRNMMPFVVRDDETDSDITFQTSDTTWQAYNWWGGYNFYGGIAADGREGRASKLSYNRPIITRDGGYAAGPQDFIFSVEYPTIRWLEENGYDVDYISGIDTDRSPSQLLKGDIFLSVGHDEYWSAGQRANVEAARDAGIDLAFLSGNEVYWEMRWETSIDGSGTPYRTLVSYKERWDNEDSDVGHTTSTWRDPQYGSGRPENSLTGTMFTVDTYRLDTIEIPYDLSNFRFWNNTAVGDLLPGEVYELTKNLLGYEWDSDVDNGFRPAGLIQLSNTTVDVQSLLLDYGNTTGNGTATHALTLYRAPSGALVFGAGSVYWSWGLDSNHDNEATPTDRNVQQAMVNLFADMGVQPATLAASLAAALETDDDIAPVSTVNAPQGPFSAGTPITLTGTAVDSGGGIVAVVEVSTNNGMSWHRATGYGNWSYTWTPLAGGTYQVRTRAVDDSVNLEVPGAATAITVEAAPTLSVFAPDAIPAETSVSDTGQVNLGMTFTSSQSGSIVGMRYYKGLGDGGTHVGSVWTAGGTLLKSATFTAESNSGWQTVTFDSPLQVTAGMTYMASYTSHGHYATTTNYFGTPVTSGPLTAQNGFYQYGSSTTFPSFQSGTNYWVDVIFTPTPTANEVPVGVNDNGFLAVRDRPITFSAASLLANDSDPNGDPLTITGVGSVLNGTVTYDSASKTVTFTPTAGFVGEARFGYSISDGRGGVGSAFVNMSVVEPYRSLFTASDVPATLNSGDTAQVTLGLRFTASVAGSINGVRYYRGAGDLGSHTGTLWTSTGTVLATGTFTNETGSGWQTLMFGAPVSVTAGTTYVAGYHSNGNYVSTAGYFGASYTNGPLTGLGGVFAYGSGNPFPTGSYGNANYWADVVFTPNTTANAAPTAVADSGFVTQRETALVIAASQLLANDTDPNGDTLSVTGVSGATNGTVAFNAQTGSLTFTPTAGYTGAAGFTYSIADGAGGTSSAAVNLNVTAPPNYQTVFAQNATPGTVTVNEASSVELGMRFSASVDGSVSVIRFYKGAQNIGSHTGNLWTSTGILLGSVTFSGESASGWQTATFTSPIALTAGVSYVASYHTSGYYSADGGYFGSPVTNGALTATAGVFAYGAGTNFPNQSYNNANYWVDVGFTPNAPVANRPPVAVDDGGFVTATNTPLTIAGSSLLANDTDPDNDTLRITGVGGAQNGSVSFDAANGTVTFTPTQGMNGPAGFTYTVADTDGSTAQGNVSLTVNASGTVQTLFAANDMPATVTVNDQSPVELGMKFSSSTDGSVTGVRFYKGAQNTGIHTGSLWTSTGTRIATVTFTNESASGWQSANFNAPVQIAADTTYVVSYHTNGNYSVTSGGFDAPITRGSLTASSGNNGVFAYGGTSAFPTGSYNNSNYWVDVTFSGPLVA